MRVSVDLSPGERLSFECQTEGLVTHVPFEQLEEGQAAALRQMLSGQGGYFFQTAAPRPADDLPTRIG